ncbi:hypothetical protein CS542_01560 [Pedobacter sp. IW39]|nr:hypothetical protein CS542_01560 [Pedobacter sp. IW39]
MEQTNFNRSFKIKWDAKFKDSTMICTCTGVLFTVNCRYTGLYGLVMSFPVLKECLLLSGGSMAKRVKQQEIKILLPPNRLFTARIRSAV